MKSSSIWTLTLAVFASLAAAGLASCGSASQDAQQAQNQPLTEQEQLAIYMMQGDVGMLVQPAMEGRETGTKGAKMAGYWLWSRMIENGLTAAGDSGFFHNFVHTPRPAVQVHGNTGGQDEKHLGLALVQPVHGFNVLGASEANSKSWGVIGAHYDHLGFGDESSLFRPEGDESVLQIHPGADDNASGVAVMLELARRNKQERLTSENVLFAGFSGEEKGLWGSKSFCSNPTVPLEDIRWMINFDMVGRMHGDSLLVYGTGTSPVWPALVDSCNKAGLHLVIDPSGVGPSDHTSFYLEGIPVLHFFTGQHAQYHKPTDTADLLNHEGMLAITDYAQCLVAGLDAIEKVPYTATADSTKDETPAFKVTLGVMPDYMYTAVGMRIDGVNPGRPAEKAGMHRGDIVVKMDTLEVVDMTSYMQGLALFEPGQTVTVEYIRSDERMSAEVTWD